MALWSLFHRVLSAMHLRTHPNAKPLPTPPCHGSQEALLGLTLENLPVDILCLVIPYLERHELLALASVSGRLRSIYMPMLFRNCRTYPTISGRIPPKGIRPHVKHLACYGSYSAEHDSAHLYSEIGYLPNATALMFDYAERGVPFFVIRRCLKYPNITSLSFGTNARWTLSKPDTTSWVSETFPAVNAKGRLVWRSLTSLSYENSIWKELRARLANVDFVAQCTVEARCLRPVILGMRNTSESLDIPVEASPLYEMALEPWPRMKSLSLRGFYLHAIPSATFSSLLTHMPHLRTLSIQVAQREGSSRAAILGADAAPTVHLKELQSLTVAYPDPQDALFSIPLDDLTHLSLRDWPRHYYYKYRWHEVVVDWVAPILSASETLYVLTRISSRNLESLEIVYEVDDSEDELLHHIATAYPYLSDLEVHRYTAEYEMPPIPHVHIARILASVPALRRVNLNLDSPSGPTPLSSEWTMRGKCANPWGPAFERRAREIFDVFHAMCPRLDRVALLCHDGTDNVWVPFCLQNGICICRYRMEDEREDAEGPFRHREWSVLARRLFDAV